MEGEHDELATCVLLSLLSAACIGPASTLGLLYCIVLYCTVLYICIDRIIAPPQRYPFFFSRAIHLVFDCRV